MTKDNAQYLEAFFREKGIRAEAQPCNSDEPEGNWYVEITPEGRSPIYINEADL